MERLDYSSNSSMYVPREMYTLESQKSGLERLLGKVSGSIKGIYERIKSYYNRLPGPIKAVIKTGGIYALTLSTLLTLYKANPGLIEDFAKRVVEWYLNIRGINLSFEEALSYVGGMRGILERIAAIPAGAYLGLKVLHKIFRKVYGWTKLGLEKIKAYIKN